VGLTLSACAAGWIAYELRGLTQDISTSHSSVPTAVNDLLPPGTDILDRPQVILVRYTSGISRTAAVLVSTVPDRKLVAFMTVPPSTSVHGAPLGGYSTPDAIKAFDAEQIHVTHVALIEPEKVPLLVDRLGGVTVDNPLDFTVRTRLGATVHFPRGKDRLDGQRAALYVHAATTNEELETASSAVLGGIVRAMVSDAPVGRIHSIADAMASSVSSDLSTADVLGLVELRLRGGVVLQCHAFRRTSLRAPAVHTAVERFLGGTGYTGGPCSAREVSSKTSPPEVVVNFVRHYGWKLFGGIAAILSLLALTAAGVLAARWPRTARQPQTTPPPPLTWPPPGA
jgi:hypothetical protein